MIEILVLLVLGAGVWYWFDGMRTREIAVAAGRHACNAAHVQFLDDSVSLVKIRLGRDEQQQLHLTRLYRFEFSNTGDNRRPGQVHMMGQHTKWVNLDGEWQAGQATVTPLHS